MLPMEAGKLFYLMKTLMLIFSLDYSAYGASLVQCFVQVTYEFYIA